MAAVVDNAPWAFRLLESLTANLSLPTGKLILLEPFLKLVLFTGGRQRDCLQLRFRSVFELVVHVQGFS